MNFCIKCDNMYYLSIPDDDPNKLIYYCKNCGHVQLSPIPTLEEEKKFYDENLQDKNIGDVGSLKRAYNKMKADTIRRAKLVQKFTPKGGRILEIGSGHGFFLDVMNKKDYEILGIEISKEKRKFVKSVTNVKILNVNINETVPDIGPFDTIVFFHVLEHITNPELFLNNCKKLLKHNGCIIAEVPNYDDFQITLNKFYRNFYWQRAHLSYFNPKSITTIFKKSGLKNIKIIGTQRYSIENMINWRLTNKPQIDEPTYNLPRQYDWVELNYKKKIVDTLTCDTIICIGEKNN